MLEAQITDALDLVRAKADAIQGISITVINADGSVTTSLVYSTDKALAMLGAVEIAKDQIKAQLTFALC